MTPRTASLLLALALFAAGGVALAAGRSKPALPDADQWAKIADKADQLDPRGADHE